MLCERTRKNRRPASVTLEAAVALPIFFLILFGIFEYGRFFLMRNLLANAAREGCRFAVVHTTTKTTADVQAVVTNFLGNQQAQLTNFNIQVYSADANGNPITGILWNATPFGSGIGVEIDGDYKPVMPVLLAMPGLIHLKTVSVMNCEGN
jgi:Flp pilus assembly protein TadG